VSDKVRQTDNEAINDSLVGEDSKATDTQEFIEFVGQEPYGTEFYGLKGTHSIDKKHMKDQHDVDLGAKEIVWKRGSNGRFLVPVSDMSLEAAEALVADPLFKRVTA
jgi:hypothetical protein